MPPPTENPAAEKVWRILAIDDDSAVLETYRTILLPDEIVANLSTETEAIRALFIENREENPPLFTLDTATSGKAGLERVEHALQQGRPYAVCLLDMRMPPGWDGLTTAKKIRAIDPNICIIIITAYMECSMDEIRRQIGVDFDFIHKTAIQSELFHLTHLHAQQWSQNRELQQYREHLEEMVKRRTAELQRANRTNKLLLEEKTYEFRELNLILNAMREGVVVVDQQGNITHANRSIERLSGSSEPDLLGTAAIKLFHKSTGEQKSMDSQTLSMLHPQLQQLIGSSCTQIESWIDDALLPALLIDEAGTIIAANQVVRNVVQWSPQQLIGEALEMLLPRAMRKGHAKLVQRFFEQPAARKMGRSQLFPLLQPDGTLAELEIGLLPLNVGENRRVLILLNDPEQDQWWQLFSITPFGQLFFEEGDLNMGVEIQPLEGPNIPVYISSSPLYLSGAQGDQQHGAILVVHDLRTVLIAEKERSANQAKDQFLASTSHELRTPLTTIIGNCEMLAQQQLRNREQEMVRSIDIAGRSLLSLINDILDLSKIEAGKFQIDQSPFSLSELLRQIQHIFSNRAHNANLEFTVVHSSPPSQQLVGDSRRISQILVNLLGNAIKFTEAGFVRLYVELLEEMDQLIFRIEDSGIGISKAAQLQLFQPYKQADDTISNRFGGTGLGLHISKILAELMGGTIHVESSESSGSTFTLTLPLHLSEEIDSGTTALNARHYDPLQGRVLVAEDTPELQILLQQLLESFGVTVTIARQGLEAIDLALPDAFDLILMDMEMPLMDGIEATHTLRQRGDRTPIVALTANAMQQHRQQFEAAGCSGFLVKPIDHDALYKILSHYLQPAEAKRAAVPPNRIPNRVINDEMHTLFQERTLLVKTQLNEALTERNWTEVRALAHTVKGSGTTFGFPELTKRSAALCNAIDEDIEAQIPALAESLIQEMERALR